VTTTVPAAGATGVSASVTPAATFSEPLNPTTVTAATFLLRTAAGQPVAGNVSYNPTTRTATFTPASPLGPQTGYIATATTGIKDVAGNSLAANVTWTFTTGAPGGFALGYNAVGGIQDWGDQNHLNGSRFTTGASGVSVSSMTVYIGTVAPAPQNQFQLAIYTDASGSPGSLVASSGTGTVTSAGWHTLPISATLAPNTAYWLAYNTNGDNNLRYDSAPAGSSGYTGWVSFGSWPSTAGAVTLVGVRFSIYASQ
jgi:hypothetical protein